VERSISTSFSSTEGVGSVPPCAPPSAARGRHSGPGLRRLTTKRRVAVVDHLERTGGWVDETELARRLGVKRARDVRRRHLAPLEEAQVVESKGRRWRLTRNWRVALEEVVEEDRALERSLYGGQTSDERQKELHLRSRESFRNRDQVVVERAPTHAQMRQRRESFPDRRRAAIRQAVDRLFAERPEYQGRRVGQIRCAIVMFDLVADGFPRGSLGPPTDREVELILRENGVAA
jgi:hypothetical protein